MKFTIAVIATLLTLSTAVVLPRTPQNQNRPVPSGECCVANTSLKQDTCTASNGETGRCVPGGNACESSLTPISPDMSLTIPLGGGSLSCVAQSNLQCDDSVIERGNSLCRAIAGNGGLFDGANIINDLAQATVN